MVVPAFRQTIMRHILMTTVVSTSDGGVSLPGHISMNSTENTYSRYRCEMPDASRKDSSSYNVPGRDGVSVGVYLLILRENCLLPSGWTWQCQVLPKGWQSATRLHGVKPRRHKSLAWYTVSYRLFINLQNVFTQTVLNLLRKLLKPREK